VWHSITRGDPVRVLPDGCMDLLWSGDGIVIAGPDTHAHVFARRPGVAVTGLRFAPGFAPRVIGAPAHTFTNERVPLDTVWRSSLVRRLEDDLSASDDPGAALERLALAVTRPRHTNERLVDRIIDRVRAAMPVARIANEVGLSSRQLHRRCLDAFGYGPKTLARVLRMTEALEMARTGVSFADTAARAGYADQSHLARDVRELAGVSLSQLVGDSSGANRSTELPSGSRTLA
jgi:AraC-like DNA-binding protein